MLGSFPMKTYEARDVRMFLGETEIPSFNCRCVVVDAGPISGVVGPAPRKREPNATCPVCHGPAFVGLGLPVCVDRSLRARSPWPSGALRSAERP